MSAFLSLLFCWKPFWWLVYLLQCSLIFKLFQTSSLSWLYYLIQWPQKTCFYFLYLLTKTVNVLSRILDKIVPLHIMYMEEKNSLIFIYLGSRAQHLCCHSKLSNAFQILPVIQQILNTHNISKCPQTKRSND